jgi:glycerol-3-phosphate dehydrogenase
VTQRSREETLERLAAGTYDVLVVGAGIIGSRVAYDCARAGCRVALVDTRDFGAATTSASTKLLHGGLRYLRTGQLRLVRRAQRERRLLETRIAPSLVWPLPLVLADVRGGVNRVQLPAAIALYRALAAGNGAPPRLLGPAEARTLVPPLETTATSGAAIVVEGQTHDSRLALANVSAAARAGADVLSYARLVALEWARGPVGAGTLELVPERRTLVVGFRAVVNCTGPWIDRVRRLEDPGAGDCVRLSKGVNVVLPLDQPWRAGLAVFDTARSAVAAPWHGVLVVGATDAEFDGPPEEVSWDEHDVAALLRPFEELLPEALLRPERVLSASAGLRVLERGDGPTTHASRDEIVRTGPRGMVSVAGGKLTTHRLISAAALRALPAEVRVRLPRAEQPIASAPEPSALAALREAVGEDTARYLAALYGGEICALVREGEAAALDPVVPGGPDVWGQAFRARDDEWALSVDDVVERRTTLALRGLATAPVRARLAAELGLPHAVARPGVAPESGRAAGTPPAGSRGHDRGEER